MQTETEKVRFVFGKISNGQYNHWKASVRRAGSLIKRLGPFSGCGCVVVALSLRWLSINKLVHYRARRSMIVDWQLVCAASAVPTRLTRISPPPYSVLNSYLYLSSILTQHHTSCGTNNLAFLLCLPRKASCKTAVFLEPTL